MLSNIHFCLGPLPIGIIFHWLHVSRSRFNPSMEVCWARRPPIIADHHDTPAVTGGLHPLLDISPKNWTVGGNGWSAPIAGYFTEELNCSLNIKQDARNFVIRLLYSIKTCRPTSFNFISILFTFYCSVAFRQLIIYTSLFTIKMVVQLI